jgi:hypothetical protein
VALNAPQHGMTFTNRLRYWPFARAACIGNVAANRAGASGAER